MSNYYPGKGCRCHASSEHECVCTDIKDYIKRKEPKEPKMSNECKHGRLKRKCEVCYLENELAERDKRIDSLSGFAISLGVLRSDFEQTIDALRADLETVKRERGVYEATLKSIAHDGCGCSVRENDLVNTCRDRTDDHSEWCWCCIAAEALGLDTEGADND